MNKNYSIKKNVNSHEESYRKDENVLKLNYDNNLLTK